MIVHDSRGYRIERCRRTPLPFALDRKKKEGRWTHLVNIGWYPSYEKALAAMAEDATKKTGESNVSNSSD